jgi:DNA-binding response OmpR family regulator
VFDRYFQTNHPDRPARGGTGIGLALCREYIQLLGGNIQVESEAGNGATFVLTFPVQTVEEDIARAGDETAPLQNGQRSDGEGKAFAPLQPELMSPAGAGGRRIAKKEPNEAPKPTILVVEDNPDLQDYIRLILSGQYRVLTANNGQEALKQLAAAPDCRLILSDLMMPVMDGYQLLERLKSSDETRHLPVIMLTARADTRDKLKALRLGVDDYLIKPFDESELMARIANMLRNQMVRRRESQKLDQSVTNRELLTGEDQQWLEAFENYIQENLASDLLSIPTLAGAFAMSESTLLRQVKRLTGLSPVQYLQEARLNEARRLLEAKRFKSVSQVASAVGYENVRSFSRTFKKRFGKIPSKV